MKYKKGDYCWDGMSIAQILSVRGNTVALEIVYPPEWAQDRWKCHVHTIEDMDKITRILGNNINSIKTLFMEANKQ